MKKYAKWAGNLIVGVLLVVMLVLVFFTVGSKFSPDGLPKIGKYQLMVVLSGSMSPVFEAGDVIIVSGKKDPDQYKKGDIITFKDPQDPKKIVTHRIIEAVKKGKLVSYRTKGDANKVPDLVPVPSGNVLGQQKLGIPYFGRLVEFAKTKQGLIWLIIVPGFFIIASELRNIAKVITDEIERKKREAVAKPWTEEPND